MPMPIGNKGMQKDYLEDARRCIAIVYDNGQPMLKRTDYPKEIFAPGGKPLPWFWHRLVLRVATNPQVGGRLVWEDSPEGRAILKGVTLSEITQEYLMSISDEELANVAQRFGVKVSTKRKATVMGILRAKEEGIEMAAAAASGE